MPNTVNNKINSLQFSYRNPDDNYKKFESEYTSKAYVMRKILATPLCAISIVKMIINLAKAIFYGIPQSFKGNRLPLQAAIYHAVRDMQSALGLIIMIFNDKMGLYITDNAWTQKDYYISVIEGNIDPVDEAIEITLFNFQKMIAEERQEAIKKFKLQDSLDKMGGKEEFFKKLSASSEEVLKLCYLFSDENFDESSNWIYALLSDDAFGKLTLNELKDASKAQGKFIAKRLKLLEDQIPSKTESLSDLSLLDLPIINLPNVSAIEINQVLDKFPSSLYILITDEQLKTLDLKNLRSNHLKALFPYDSSGKQKTRFAQLSIEQVQSILSKLDETRLSYISDEQLKKLDLKDLTQKQLKKLFPKLSEEGIRKESEFSYSNVNSKVTEEEKSGMTKEEVQKEIQSRIQLNTARLAILSDEQFDQIKDKLDEAIQNLRK
jgi:hypothetical protein